MEKKSGSLIIIIVVLLICVLGLSGFIVYDKLVITDKCGSKVEKLEKDEEDNNDKYVQLIEDSFDKWEDDKYIRYRLRDANQYVDNLYLVYDKESKTYLNEKLSTDDYEAICYFDKIAGQYYYFVMSINPSVVTKIYNGNGELVKTIDGAYVNYDMEKREFKFKSMPTTVNPTVEYWNPFIN